MLVTLDEARALINENRILHIAGDESLLAGLPKGRWIGGSTPYFIGDAGGIFSKELLFVNEIDFAEDCRIAVYGKYNVFQMVEDCYDHGLNIIILPSTSDVMKKYAKDAPEVDELLLHPTIGWVSGYNVRENGQAYVFNGMDGRSYTDRAVVMFLKLPENKEASINILNIFEDDKTDSVITFPYDTTEVNKCRVNGYEIDLAEYIEKKNIDIRKPLVADNNGVYINTSIKAIVNGTVYLYSPVFRGTEYRFAAEISDYEEEFKKHIAGSNPKEPVFSCNCILNYMYGNLEGKKTPPYTGPVTFGEIAYQLVNQTLVYCEIV